MSKHDSLDVIYARAYYAKIGNWSDMHKAGLKAVAGAIRKRTKRQIAAKARKDMDYSIWVLK